jgi:CRISPR/Cas system-associated exonuclease Cas4 (RecB family)
MSAVSSLDQCPRAYYLGKYVGHAGWHPNATPRCRDAYSRKGAHNAYSFPGDVVHRLCAQAINDACVTPGNARGWMIERGRELVAHGVNESMQGEWKTRKATRIMEHERGERFEAADVLETVNRHIRALTSDGWTGGHNLFLRLLEARERVEQVEQLVKWEGLGIPMWLAIDVLVRGARDGEAVVLDWKTGKPKPEHATQIQAYGAYAASIGYASVRLCLVYTGAYPVRVETYTPSMAECGATARAEFDRFRGSIAARLVDGDLARNEPEPEAAWEPRPSGVCRFCAFRELCPAG